MNKKRTIKKFLFFAMWLVVIGGMTSLLLAANSRQQQHLCREVLIGIKGSGEKFYIEKDDIQQLLESRGGPLVNKPIPSVNIGALEKTLEGHSWIRDAELYFDSKDALHVYVEEREPVARVFATNGNSFYIDSSGHKMALVDQLSARVPVITGFPLVKRMTARDSALMNEVKEVALFVYGHPFWNAQIGQIDITPDRKFECIPLVGDHIIRLGSGAGVEEKLNRLYVFYSQVMRKVGFGKYAALDLQFDKQVIAVKKEAASPVDSIQLQKNIEELVNRASLQEIDEQMLPGNQMPIKKDSIVSTTTNPVPTKTNPNPVESNRLPSNPAKTTNPSKPPERPKHQPKVTERPKAVMRRAG